MKHALVVLLFLWLLASGCGHVTPSKSHRARQRPNVVIFFVDDSGWGDYSHNGNPTIDTPHIDRLAAEGAFFTQFYVTTAACSASRYSLLTGRYPGRSGLGSWVIGPGSPRYIHPEEITLAEGLKSAGYATGLFGKWHLGTPNAKNGLAAESLPLAHGFDEWIGTNVSHDYDHARLLRSDPEGTNPVPGYVELARDLPTNPEASKSLTGLYTDAAMHFIRENADRPFFAYVAYNQPHLGLYVADRFRGTSRRGLLGDVLAEVDDSVGRVMGLLEELGVADDTLIIFSSDNGPWVRYRNTANHPKYGEARLHVGYAYPFRDGKGSTWEGGHRVPGIFYWPGTIPPHRELRPASTLDVLPTIFSLCGVPVPNDRSIDGRDVRPYLSPSLAPTLDVPPFEFLFSYSDNRPSAIRMGAWKLHIRIGSQLKTNYGFTASREKPLLFQVEQDLGERIDRAEEQPQRVKVMLRRLEEMEAQINDAGTFWNDAPSSQER
ncbi:MAG TPA: arylsulfatase [Planctomycetes bacterium]|nr:arylsulfatase [Planctomycetota bacterium]